VLLDCKTGSCTVVELVLSLHVRSMHVTVPFKGAVPASHAHLLI
jgi:hypothetical protein